MGATPFTYNMEFSVFNILKMNIKLFKIFKIFVYYFTVVQIFLYSFLFNYTATCLPGFKTYLIVNALTFSPSY